jgi:hypothetical protein
VRVRVRRILRILKRVRDFVLSMELDPCGCDICNPIKGVCPFLDPNRKRQTIGDALKEMRR